MSGFYDGPIRRITAEVPDTVSSASALTKEGNEILARLERIEKALGIPHVLLEYKIEKASKADITVNIGDVIAKRMARGNWMRGR